jgi:hypothetical protein
LREKEDKGAEVEGGEEGCNDKRVMKYSVFKLAICEVFPCPDKDLIQIILSGHGHLARKHS